MGLSVRPLLAGTLGTGKPTRCPAPDSTARTSEYGVSLLFSRSAPTAEGPLWTFGGHTSTSSTVTLVTSPASSSWALRTWRLIGTT